jgi:hypothetical protein
MQLSEKFQERLGSLAGLALAVTLFICVDTALTQGRSRVQEGDRRADVSKWENGTQSVSYGNFVTYREVVDSNGDGLPDYTAHKFGAPRRGYYDHKVTVTKKDQEMFSFGLSRYEQRKPFGIVNTLKQIFQ